MIDAIAVSKRSFGVYNFTIVVQHKFLLLRWQSRWGVVVDHGSIQFYEETSMEPPSRMLRRRLEAAVRAAQCASSSRS